MKASEPPRFATWVPERLAPRLKRESLLGDLIEQYHNGRSAAWYRRQVLTAVLTGAGAAPHLRSSSWRLLPPLRRPL
jgi:hypothetical protein